MPQDTTIIKGEAVDQVCLDHATFMLLDNYQKDPNLLQPESAAAMREIDAKWDRVTTSNIGVEKPSGFYATMYTPKDGNDCPPTLALRGTVFDDARGIAIALRVKAYPAFAPERSAEFAYGWAPGYRVGEEEEDPSRLQQFGYFSRKFGFVEKLTESGEWVELFARQNLNTHVLRRIPLITPLIPLPADYREIVLDCSLELWLNKDEGDWATNVLQGVGVRTVQYGEELKSTVQDALDEADQFGKQLRITGHSLGGGLASAAALYAKSLDPEAEIYGLAYDAAGVHPNTAKDLFSSLDRASDAKIIVRAVEDEVLTSMEKTADFVPIASSVIRFTGSTMPPPIGAYSEKKGISPGPLGNSWAEGNAEIIKGHEYAPKWSRMPNLLEIGAQDLIPRRDGGDPLATWGNLAGHFANASTLRQAMDNLNGEIERRVNAQRDARADREFAEAAAERASEAEDAAREAAAERAEAAAEAASERADAAREAAAEAAEAQAERAAAAREAEEEANEPTGLLGLAYNVFYDNPRDAARSIGQGARELGDEISDAGAAVWDEAGDAGRYIADEAGDLGREAWDEMGDGLAALGDGADDLLNYAYEHTAQYLMEFGKYGQELAAEAGDFGKLFGAVAAYHDMELAAFTFALDRS